MARQTTITATLYGTLHGRIWQGCTAQLPITADLSRAKRAGGFAETIAATLRKKGGDFQFAKLTGDSRLHVECVRYIGNGRRIVRERDVALECFPSLAAFVDTDTETLQDD